MIKSDFTSFIVLTHNNEKHIENCIKSIIAQKYDNYEIVIVDNNSTDGTQKILLDLKQKEKIKVILNSQNLGFNLGNKTGIKNSSGNYISIVNPDSILNKSWISSVLSILTKDNKIMVVFSTLINKDGTIQSMGGVMDKFCAVKQRNMSNHNEEFFYVPGSAFIFKRKILDEVTLDSNLFLYYDDVDFCWQARLLGFKLGFSNDAKVIHLEGGSLMGLPTKKYFHILKNRLYIALKNYSISNLIKRIFLILALECLNSVYYSWKMKSPRYLGTFVTALYWNIVNIKKTLNQRSIIQKKRILSDKEIDRFMEKESIEIDLFLKNLRVKN